MRYSWALQQYIRIYIVKLDPWGKRRVIFYIYFLNHRHSRWADPKIPFWRVWSVTSAMKISVMTKWLVWTGLMSFKWKSQCGKVSPQLLHSQFHLHLVIYSTGSKYRLPHSQMHQLGRPPSTQSTQLDSISKQGRVTSDTSAIPIHHLHT